MTFTVDTTAPVVSMNAVASPTNDATPTLTGGAGAASWDEPSVTVTIHEGASLSGRVAASKSVSVSGGTWSYTAPHLADGSYTAQAEQSDDAGNLGKSAEVKFTVDTTPPAVTLTALPHVLHVSRPTFSGRAGVAGGDDPSITLKIYEGPSVSGSPTQELDVAPDGAEWTTGSTGPALPNGIYTAQAEQSDDAGNTGTSHSTFTIETKSPEVTIDTSGFVRRGTRLLTGPTPSFSGSAATEPEDSKSVIVNVYSGTSASGVLVQTLEGTRSGSAWTVGPVQALPDGIYTVQAEQMDSAVGDQTGVSASATFTVDADSPQVTLTSPANGSSTSSSSQTVSGSAGTDEGDLPEITVQLYAGSTVTGQSPLEAVTVEASGESWSAVFGGLSPGTYTAQAEQRDDVGNTGHSAPVTFTVTVAPVEAPPTPPTPSPPAASFKWIPSAPNTGEPVTLISTSTDVSSPITGFAWAPGGNGTFNAGESTLSTSFATPGAHVMQLRVSAADGLSSVVAETITVTSPAPTLMQPFPVVHMAGSYNASGVKISLLTVLAPVGVTVTVTCRGGGCPTKAQDRIAASGNKSKTSTVLMTFRRFERSLRAGAILEVWVSNHGQIGKFTRFLIHHGKAPSRQDLCLNPAGTKPFVCPS